ncbi:MAG: hypothetical protein ACIAQZ_00085 [Sedimentisphaeraceae bacterium JB056]
MKKTLTLILIFSSLSLAECSLDHLIVGCNQDGISGTSDDNKLFSDCSQKYRNSGSISFETWYYPLNSSFFTDYKYRIGEPGFDMFQATDSNAAYTYNPAYALAGDPNDDYQIIIECINISPGLRVVYSSGTSFTIDEAGESFDYSYIHKARNNPHIHLSFQATDKTSLKWITWQLHDTLDDGSQYLSSEPFTIVFNTAPISGDLYIDDIADSKDLLYFADYWLETQGSRENDFYERADTNRDGNVDLTDFAAIAENWLIE